MQQLSGRALDPQRITLLREEGAIAVDADGRLRVTKSGFPVLDAVVARPRGVNIENNPMQGAGRQRSTDRLAPDEARRRNSSASRPPVCRRRTPPS